MKKAERERRKRIANARKRREFQRRLDGMGTFFIINDEATGQRFGVTEEQFEEVAACM